MSIVKPRLAAGSALLGLLLAVALVLPTFASAAKPVACYGHTEAGKANAPGGDDDLTIEANNPLDYVWLCTEPVLGFTIGFSREITTFRPEVEVFAAVPPGSPPNTAPALVPTNSFNCEGDFPGFGINCAGSFSAGGNFVRGTVGTTDPVCDEPRTTAQLYVSVEDLNANGTRAGRTTGRMAGPFNLGRPQKCARKSSRLQGLLAEVQQARGTSASPAAARRRAARVRARARVRTRAQSRSTSRADQPK